MEIKKPASMDECVYFTNRLSDSARITAWVFRKECPKCKKGIMGKPKKKGGKIDKKADHYDCYLCGYSESNEQVESNLTMNIDYKCQHCSNEGLTTTEYKRKTFEGVQSYIFECQKCHKKIGITKKLKEAKKKSAAKEDNNDLG